MLKAGIVSKVTAANIGEGQSIAIAGLPVRVALLYVALFVAAFLFYSALWTTAPIVKPDSGGYLRAAQALANFPFDQLQDRAPGYPLFLLLTGSVQSPNRSSFYVSLLLHFVSIWLLATVLCRANVRESMLILFGFILLLPPFTEPAGYVMTENLAEMMLTVAFAGLVFWYTNKSIIWIVIAAFGSAYAGLTRPTYQLLGFAFVGYLLLARFPFSWLPLRRRDSIKASSIIITCSVLMIGGYAFFNYQNFGHFVVTPKFGLTLSTKTARVIERLPDHLGVIKETLIRGRNEELVKSREHTGYMYIWSTLPELQKITGLNQAQLSGYMLKLNLLLMKSAPFTYLEEVLWSLGSYWLPSSGELANFNSRFLQAIWAIMHFFLIGGFVIYVILLIGAMTYIKKCRGLGPTNEQQGGEETKTILSQGFTYGLAGLIIIYTAAISCVFEVGDPRYRVPTDPLIVFVLFLGRHIWKQLISDFRTASCD